MTKEELEKENAELDCQKNRNKSCYSCANATERCFRNEICCPCQKYKSYKEENAELKKEVEKHKWNNIFLEDCAGFDKKIAEEYTTSQERIEKLEQQIEKMKCCENCKFRDCDKSSNYQTCWYCKNKDKWQLRR